MKKLLSGLAILLMLTTNAPLVFAQDNGAGEEAGALITGGGAGAAAGTEAEIGVGAAVGAGAAAGATAGAVGATVAAVTAAVVAVVAIAAASDDVEATPSHTPTVHH